MSAVDLLAGSPLDETTGDDRGAEVLVALAHECVDWDTWGGSRALRYWDALTDRVRASCYAGPRLTDWWGRITRQMQLTAITLTHVRAHHYAPPAPKTARGGLTRITAQPATTQHPLPAHTDDGCTYRKGCGCADCHAISAERRARDRAKVRSA